MVAFYLDANLSAALAWELRRWGYAAMTAAALGYRHAKDYEHMVFAAQRGEVLVTHDRDFILLHKAWRHWTSVWQVQEHHAGVLIIPDTWLAPKASLEIHAFIQTGQPLVNQAYEWKQQRGWIQH